MYLYILDHSNSKVIVNIIPEFLDAKQYVSDHYGLENIDWMLAETLGLDIQIDPSDLCI